MAVENLEKTQTITFLAATELAVNSNVKLDTSTEGYVVAASGATDVIIGAVKTVEGSGSTSKFAVSVPCGAVKLFSCTGAIAIGNRLVPNSSGLLVAQAVNLSGTAFKHSVGIALQPNSSGAATLKVLQVPAYIPV